MLLITPDVALSSVKVCAMVPPETTLPPDPKAPEAVAAVSSRLSVSAPVAPLVTATVPLATVPTCTTPRFNVPVLGTAVAVA